MSQTQEIAGKSEQSEQFAAAGGGCRRLPNLFLRRTGPMYACHTVMPLVQLL